MEIDDDAKMAQAPGYGTKANCSLLQALSLALHRQMYGHSPVELSPEDIFDRAVNRDSWPIRERP